MYTGMSAYSGSQQESDRERKGRDYTVQEEDPGTV